MRLADPLPKLFGPDRTNAVQTKAERDAVLESGTDVERIVLSHDRAAIESVTCREQRTDHRRALRRPTVLKVEKDRGAPEGPSLPVAQKDRRAPL